MIDIGISILVVSITAAFIWLLYCSIDVCIDAWKQIILKRQKMLPEAIGASIMLLIVLGTLIFFIGIMLEYY